MRDPMECGIKLKALAKFNEMLLQHSKLCCQKKLADENESFPSIEVVEHWSRILPQNGCKPIECVQ